MRIDFKTRRTHVVKATEKTNDATGRQIVTTQTLDELSEINK